MHYVRTYMTLPVDYYRYSVVNGYVSVSCIILLQYLDGLFQKDPKAGGQYHQRQVELYATYDPDKLLPFLRSCNDIPLQKVCVYIRMYT